MQGDTRKRVSDLRGSSPKRSRHDDDYSHRGRSPPRAPDYVTRVLISAPQLARVIGRAGMQINAIRQNCGIRVETVDLSGDDRMVSLSGSLRGINDGFGMIVRCLEDPSHEFEPFKITVLVPTDKAGLVVGARGAVVKEIKAKTGVEDLMVGHRDDVKRIADSHGSTELRICHILGAPRDVVKAHALMNEKVNGVTEEYDERQRGGQRAERREPEPYASRMPDVMSAPPPAHQPRQNENDRMLDMHRVPGLIAREVEQLEQALEPYGLMIQLVSMARRRDNSRERSYPRTSYDSRDIRYDPYRTSMEPPRDRIRDRSPPRRDVRDRDFSPSFRRDRDHSIERAPPAPRPTEVETCFSIPADKAGAVIGKQGVGCRKIENDFRVRISIARDSANGERSVVIRGAEQDNQAARARIEQIIESTPDRPAPRAAASRNDSVAPHSTPQHDPHISDVPSTFEGGYGYSLDPYGSSIAADYGGSYGDNLSYSSGGVAAPQGAAAGYGSWDADIAPAGSQSSEPAPQP